MKELAKTEKALPEEDRKVRERASIKLQAIERGRKTRNSIQNAADNQEVEKNSLELELEEDNHQNVEEIEEDDHGNGEELEEDDDGDEARAQ